MKETSLPIQKKSNLWLVSALVVAGMVGYGVAVAEERPEAAALDTPVVVQNGFADLVESVSPAVVSVRVEHEVKRRPASFGMPSPESFGLPKGHPMEKFFRRFQERHGGGERFERPRQHRRAMGQGSGFFISPDGYVVTNHHVIEDGENIVVILHDGEEFNAELIGIDPKTDLAVLKIENEVSVPYVAFAEEDDLRVGDWVVAVGNPFGLGGTVTSGIVSGRGRDIGAGPYDDFIQIDAPINRGNSGGPTFDLNGKVVGVNAMIFSPSGGNIGIGFAIPANVVQEVIADLLEDGTVSRGWLGVQVQPVDGDIAASLGLEEAGGALISEVVANSPAEAAGLRSGDVVLGIGSEDIDRPRLLSRRVASMEVGEGRDFRIWRDGKEQSVSVTIGELPEEKEFAAVMQSYLEEGLGLTLEQSDAGVRVVAVAPESEAARKNITVGDVIVSVGVEEVSNPSQLQEQIEAAMENGMESILLLLRRGEGQHYVALPLEQA